MLIGKYLIKVIRSSTRSLRSPPGFFPVRAMHTHFQYVVLGGGNSAGYCAREYVQLGGPKGQLAIITEEPVRRSMVLALHLWQLRLQGVLCSEGSSAASLSFMRA